MNDTNPYAADPLPKDRPPREPNWQPAYFVGFFMGAMIVATMTAIGWAVALISLRMQ